MKAAVGFLMRLSRSQHRRMYQELPEEQEDNYEPPPGHAALAAATSASFSREEYLGGFVASSLFTFSRRSFSFAAIALFP